MDCLRRHHLCYSSTSFCVFIIVKIGVNPAAERDRIVGSASNMGLKSTTQVIHHQRLSSLSALSFILSSLSLFFVDFTSGYIHCMFHFPESVLKFTFLPYRLLSLTSARPRDKQASISHNSLFSVTFTWLIYTVDLCIMWNGKTTVHTSPTLFPTLQILVL